jgi:hypothetical protein
MPLSPILAWLGDVMFQLGLSVCATFLLLIFPTGRLPSPRWKIVGWLAAFSMALLFGAVLFGQSAFEGLPIENPIALPESSPVLLVRESGWYLMLVAILASVTSLSAVIPNQGSSLVVAASTLVVAALFNPVRRRVQATVDRRFTRSRYDLSRTIEAFAQRLSSEVDLDQIGRDLQTVTVESMHPKTMGLWLRL